MNALQYAGLVGKYIDMERPATDAEIDAGAPQGIGMSCTVTRVADEPGGRVGIHSDYGYAFSIAPGEGWTFTIWPDEDTAKQHA